MRKKPAERWRPRDLETYTIQELAELSDHQVDQVVDLECAKHGAPMLPPRKSIDTPEVKEDGKLFTVQSLSFLTREDAEKVLDFAKTLPSVRGDEYVYFGIDYVRVIAKDCDGYVGSTDIWTVEGYERLREQYKVYRAAKAAYDAAESQYREAQKKREEVDKPIREKVKEARARKYELDRRVSAWLRYVDLAGGNTDIAACFYHDSYGPDESNSISLREVERAAANQ